jgi:mannose-6-phosphate isomerase
MLEWEGYRVDGRREGHLGLGFDLALEAVDRSRCEPSRLCARRQLGAEASSYFGLEMVEPNASAVRLPARFSILVVLEGEGALRDAHDAELQLRRGDALLIPYAAGECRLAGHLLAAVCLPPAA